MADPYNRERSDGSLCQGRISAIDVDQVDKRYTTSDWSYCATSISALDLALTAKRIRRRGVFQDRREGRSQTAPYPLIRANEALADLRSGRLQGAMVLVP